MLNKYLLDECMNEEKKSFKIKYSGLAHNGTIFCSILVLSLLFSGLLHGEALTKKKCK